MRQLTRTLLTLFAAVLALWLVVGFWPLSTVSRSVLSVCILLVCGAALWHRWRRRQFVIPVTEHVLPPEDFQGAVVLVCGDTTSLFPPDTVYRETRQGWYIHAQNAEQLPLLAQHLAAVRPALVSQVSVLLAMIPEQQTSEEAQAQTLRGWRRSITQCRNWLNGVPPVWSVAWVSPPDLHPKEEAQWFTVTPELPGVRVRQNGHVALPVTDWQWESGSRASRLYDTLWLDSILALMAHHLTRPLSARQGELPQLNLCAAGICLTPIASTEDNLWQQQIAGITTLCPKPVFAPDLLPLPEVLLPDLPRRHAPERYYHTRVKRGVTGMHDTWLILGGQQWEVDRMLERETVSLRITGTNGQLPRRALQSTLLDRCEQVYDTPLTVRNLCKPTLPAYPPAEDRFHWRVMSHLGSRFLNMMSSAEVLRGTLSLYNWRDDELNNRHLDAILDVRHHRIQRFEDGFLLRGLDVEVTLDSNGFTGEGDIHLFGELLNRFFALYADMNQFNQLTLIVQPEGKCIRWKENHSPRLPG